MTAMPLLLETKGFRAATLVESEWTKTMQKPMSFAQIPVALATAHLSPEEAHKQVLRLSFQMGSIHSISRI